MKDWGVSFEAAQIDTMALSSDEREGERAHPAAGRAECLIMTPLSQMQGTRPPWGREEEGRE